MSVVFGDTYYFVAFLNKQDRAHSSAVNFSTSFRGRIVTSEWVLVEVADALSSTRHRVSVTRFIHQLWLAKNVEVIQSSTTHLRKGLALYESRIDKDWSLTDCTSFVLMRERGIPDALTGDHHFEQAGFNALLKP